VAPTPPPMAADGADADADGGGELGGGEGLGSRGPAAGYSPVAARDSGARGWLRCVTGPHPRVRRVARAVRHRERRVVFSCARARARRAARARVSVRVSSARELRAGRGAAWPCVRQLSWETYET
jgi:hypothetical protein